MHCYRCGDHCPQCVEEIREKDAEIKRLRDELGYIANANNKSFADAFEFRAWVKNRARHALGQEAGTLVIKKQ